MILNKDFRSGFLFFFFVLLLLFRFLLGVIFVLSGLLFLFFVLLFLLVLLFPLLVVLRQPPNRPCTRRQLLYFLHPVCEVRRLLTVYLIQPFLPLFPFLPSIHPSTTRKTTTYDIGRKPSEDPTHSYHWLLSVVKVF